jgi:hypothetical protein
MGPRNGRTSEQIRRDIESEREQLARAMESLRSGIGEVTDVSTKLRSNLPVAAAAAAATGFFLAGGIGATMRFLARRGREGERAARAGRFSIVDRG